MAFAIAAGGTVVKPWLDAAWRWWCSALALPRTGRRRQSLLALWRPGGLELWQRAGGRAEPLAAPPPDQSVTLRLAGPGLWRRQFTLPRSAQPFARRIIEGDLEQRSPWRADQVYLHVDCAPTPGDRSQISVTLSLLPRVRLAPALAMLAARGWSADRLEMSDSADPASTAPLLSLATGLPVAVAQAGPWPRRVTLTVLLVTLLLLAGQGVCQAILQQRLAAARQEAKATLALAGAFGRQQRQQDFPAFRQRERGTAIDALNRLSKALPDDSWTDSVDIASAGTGLAIDVQGHAADAARLLALLEAQGFSGAEFRAPITRDEGGAQRFHLAARVPGAAHAAP